MPVLEEGCEPMDNQHELVVSFVHGYSDLNHKVERHLLPALWSVGSGGGMSTRFPEMSLIFLPAVTCSWGQCLYPVPPIL